MTKGYFVKFLRDSGKVVAMTNEDTTGVQGHFSRLETPREWSCTSVMFCLLVAGMVFFGLFHWIFDSIFKYYILSFVLNEFY